MGHHLRHHHRRPVRLHCLFALPAGNNGATGTVTFSLPSGADAGDWAVYDILNLDGDPTSCLFTTDGGSYWPVGVYVP